MYRSPAHSSRASGFLTLIFLLWGIFYLSGCTDTPSDPGFETVPLMEDAEIEMATDPDLTAALIEDVTSSMSANMTSVASLEISTAENLFGQARVELTQGDFERVRSLGDQARDALGRALAQGRDRSSLDDFIDRVRDLRRLLAAGDTDDFDRPSDLKTEIDRLLEEAIAALDRGDHETAGKRAIDAHRRADRSRVRRHDGDPEKGARLAVAMADKAVELANGLLDGTVISERQQHLLDTAARMAARSAEAYENGHFRRAIMFGHKAVSMSLMAVIRPDRVTDERIQSLTDVATSEFQVLIELAETQLAAARIALGEMEEPDEYLVKLFERAQAAFESCVEHLENGRPRGIQLIWRAAVVGAVIAS
jgi:hypothetical protein